MERVTWDKELDVLAGTQVWTDDDALAGAVAAQQKDLERIAEIVVIERWSRTGAVGVTMK